MPPRETHTPPRQFRVPEEDWHDFDTAAKTQGSERAAELRAFIAWYLHRPGSRMPKRPPAPPTTADDS